MIFFFFLYIAFARIGRSRRARSVLTESFGADLLEGYYTLQSGLSSASGMAESSSNGILESVRFGSEWLIHKTRLTFSFCCDNLRLLRSAMWCKRIGMIPLPTSLAFGKPTRLFKSKVPAKIPPQGRRPANGRGNTTMIGKGRKTAIQSSVNGVRADNTVPSVRVYNPAACPLSLVMTAKLISVPLHHRNPCRMPTSTTVPTGMRPFVGSPGLPLVIVAD